MYYYCYICVLICSSYEPPRVVSEDAKFLTLDRYSVYWLYWFFTSTKVQILHGKFLTLVTAAFTNWSTRALAHPTSSTHT